MNFPTPAQLAKDQIIVALDVDSLGAMTPLIEKLSPHVGAFKVGLQLFSAVGAPQVIQHIHRLGGQVFFDGKFDDIPNTVAAASRAVSSLGVNMFNVHASAGKQSMVAANDNKGSALCLAVTILTSIGEEEARRIFGMSPAEKVVQFTEDALDAGLDGIICSAQELEALRGSEKISAAKDFLRVTPGIRPSWSQADDQVRTLTPAEAIKAGATHLVIGRPILYPPGGIGTPIDAVNIIAEEIAGAKG